MVRTASSLGAELRLLSDHSVPLPPAHVKEEPQLLTEGGIQAAVDEWVVASGAHSQPVETEVESVRGRDGVAGQQDHVAVEREPADSENPHDQQQHGQCSSSPFPLGCVLSCCRVTNGIVTPQPAGHCRVRGTDDEEREHVKEYEGQNVYVLPVDI